VRPCVAAHPRSQRSSSCLLWRFCLCTSSVRENQHGERGLSLCSSATGVGVRGMPQTSSRGVLVRVAQTTQACRRAGARRGGVQASSSRALRSWGIRQRAGDGRGRAERYARSSGAEGAVVEGKQPRLSFTQPKQATAELSQTRCCTPRPRKHDVSGACWAWVVCRRSSCPSSPSHSSRCWCVPEPAVET
jgi:hypothetical protein